MILQKWGIVPDKIINLEIRKSQSFQRMQVYATGINQTLYDKDLDKVLEKMWAEFTTNSRQVDETFGKYIYHYDMDNKN